MLPLCMAGGKVRSSAAFRPVSCLHDGRTPLPPGGTHHLRIATDRVAGHHGA
ncbi:hypothetical protein SXCC_01810 [Gluconacetobacter sp. SXCC-1]|nr:hypothetical protein SXCC_01810 [Gluconacetobacter sp. SXCC-1]